jgi:hypothetical protein
MIDSYGSNSEYHSWLGIDPGVTTGWALVADDGAILGHGTLKPDEVSAGLDKIVRGMHRTGHAITVVVEKMPATGGMGHLASTLERVRQDVREVVSDVFDLPVLQVPPGEWKPSRVARANAWKRNGDVRLSTHESDAIRMTLYTIDRETRRA